MSRPTIVIGLGQAGCRMLESVHSLVHDEGQQDSFQFFTIDTNESDLNEETPAIGQNVTRIKLDKPDEKYFNQNHKESYHYLGGQFSLKTEEGTGRSRPMARYHVEWSQNHNKVRDQLRNGIQTFVSDTEIEDDIGSSYYQIWLLNSLGGGTGSGSFPIVASLIRGITEPMEEDFLLNGVGSLPRLVGLQDDQFPPYGRKILYANAYAALAELRVLINDYDDPKWSPPLIDVQSDVLNPGESGLELNDKLFDKYWLIGFSEEDSDELAYRDRMNRIAANGIYYLANKDQPEDFPYYDDYDEETLAAITSAELRFPTEEARDFVEDKRLIDEVEAEIKELSGEIDHHEDTVDYLTAIRRVTLDPAEGIPEGFDEISQELLRGCLGAPNDFDIPATLEKEVTIVGSEVDMNDVETVVEDVLDDARDRFREHVRSPKFGEPFDRDEVVDRLYCEALNKHLERRIQNHEFKGGVEEVWNHSKWHGEIESRFPKQFRSLNPQPVDAKWESAVEEFIKEYGPELEEERDSTLRPLTRWKLSNEIEELGEYHDTLPDQYTQFKKLTVLQDVVSSRFQGANESLADAKSEGLEHARQGLIAQKEREKADKKRKLENLKAEYDNIRDSLRKGDRKQGYFKPALRDVDRIREADLYRMLDVDALVEAELVDSEAIEDELETANIERLRRAGLLTEADIAEITDEMVVEWPSIADLVQKDILESEEVARELSALLHSSSLSDDPVQDEHHVEEYADKIVGSMMSQDNEENFPVVDDIMTLQIEGQNNVQQVVIDEFDHLIGERVETADGLSVRFATWFMPVTLENTSEFGTVNMVFSDSHQDTQQELGEGYTDEVLADSFAYPELFDGGPIAQRLEQLGRK